MSQPMNEKRCREIIEAEVFTPEGGLFSLGWYLSWEPSDGEDDAVLDGHFSADELEAIAYWMRTHKEAHL